MKVYSQDLNPVFYSTKEVMSGRTRPPFPLALDNTKISTFRACPQKFLKSYLLHRTASERSIHLTAGAAFAEGVDTFRQNFYNSDSPYKGNSDMSFLEGMYALLKSYGYDPEQESVSDWAMSPKSAPRLVMALDSYWKSFSPRSDAIKQHMINGKAASEISISFPLDVKHPVTGDPILYLGRFDSIVEYNGAIYGLDDKTTSSLGPQWMRKWDMRGQFMGYTYGARQLGLPVAGTVVRGTAILKTSIKHAQVPVSHPTHLLNKWYDQTNATVERMVEQWKQGSFDYNFADSCEAYGTCDFRDACRSQFEDRSLDQMSVYVWRPEAPEQSQLYNVDKIEKMRHEAGFYD